MHYSGNKTKEISFPIGGIGSGCFGLAGNGRFVDWEIFNRPGKGKLLGFTHIAVRARLKNGECIVKILHSDLIRDLTGQYDRGGYHGFGFGPEIGTMAGLPHFRHSEFIGEFPIAKLVFWDEDFPGRVVMTAFNPMIPLDSFHSSLPVGLFYLDFEENDTVAEYTAFLSVTNPFKPSVNQVCHTKSGDVLFLTTETPADSLDYGDMTMAADGERIMLQRYWYRNRWNDGLDVFVKELFGGKELTDREYDTAGEQDTATLAVTAKAKGDGLLGVKLLLSWNVPNNHNYWCGEERQKWKNYYATCFASSRDSAEYVLSRFDELYMKTARFKDALFSSSLDPAVIDAVSSTMSVLKSPTVLRLEDGSFYGWEGVLELAGSCEGTCQHVWNYAYALAFLFPDLERSIRDNEFAFSLESSGKSVFRMFLPRGTGKNTMRACLDGQMGIIFKTYREWKISGDSDWLSSIWNKVKLALAYAQSEENPDAWDRDSDGVLEGRQHHTLDMELFGPSSWLEGLYLLALSAAREMAEFLHDKSAAEQYSALYEKGKAWMRENLFNGEYFIQKIKLDDHSYIDQFACPEYWYEENGELKYQIGEGCEIDQALAEWHAGILGLGDIYDHEQLISALKSIYRYNYKSMREVKNTWRVFSLNDEKGVIMCSHPRGKNTIPIPYHAETMTGFEYAFAGLLIAEGMEDMGLSVIRSIRDRYDGEKRNPWNEIECGSNYARAMAAYALLPIYSGFKFDLPRKMIGFSPLHSGDFDCFFSVGTAWGVYRQREHEVRIDLEAGELCLRQFATNRRPSRLLADECEIPFEYHDGMLTFAECRLKGGLVALC